MPCRCCYINMNVVASWTNWTPTPNAKRITQAIWATICRLLRLSDPTRTRRQLKRRKMTRTGQYVCSVCVCACDMCASMCIGGVSCVVCRVSYVHGAWCVVCTWCVRGQACYRIFQPVSISPISLASTVCPKPSSVPVHSLTWYDVCFWGNCAVKRRWKRTINWQCMIKKKMTGERCNLLIKIKRAPCGMCIGWILIDGMTSGSRRRALTLIQARSDWRRCVYAREDAHARSCYVPVFV